MIGGHSCPRTPCDRFVADSALEGTGFEPSVPLLRKALLGSPWLHRSPTPERFVADSPLERDGFEPSVPLVYASAPCCRRECDSDRTGQSRDRSIPHEGRRNPFTSASVSVCV